MENSTKKALKASIDALMRVPGTKLQTIILSLECMRIYVMIDFPEFEPLMDEIMGRAWGDTPEEERHFILPEDDFDF